MPGRQQTPEPDGKPAPHAPSAPPTSAPPSFGLPGSAQPPDSGPRGALKKSPWWAAQASQEDHAEAVDEEVTERPEATRTTPVVAPVPGMLVAGPGVPSIDTRRAVPAQPLVAPPSSAYPDDTLPDGIPGVAPAPAGHVAEVPLMPDAILPPGAKSGPPGLLPSVDSPAPPSVLGSGLGGGRGLLLVGVGGLVGIVIAVVAVVAVVTLSGPAESQRGARSAPPNQSAASTPTAVGGTPRAHGNRAPSIDSERTDRLPLKLSEVFPSSTIPLGGRLFKQDKTSVNHQCSLVARGSMAEALVRGHCRSVVRATYVDTGKRLAVTSGVVAMPSRTLAVTVRRAGDPSGDEWFRGMPGKVAKNIDQAGGFAASTVRGRYIVYSYATYLDGHSPASDDPLLAAVGKRFLAYAVRPIERRSR